MHILLILFVCFLQGCGGGNSRSGVAEIKKPETSRLEGQRVEENILFLNALSSGFNLDASFKSSSDLFQQKLLGQRYLRSIAIKNIGVSKEEVVAYYNKEKNSFKRTKNQAKIYHLYTDNKPEADEIMRVLSFSGKKFEKNELFLKYNIRPSVVSQGFLIPELDKPLFSKKSNPLLHGPIKSKYGYHVLFVIEKFAVGTSIPIEEVYDEVYQRVFQTKYALKSLHVLDSLRNHTPYTKK